MLTRWLHRLRHFFELPEASLEEIQARYRPPSRPTAFEPCPRCERLVRGVHKCPVIYEYPENIERLRLLLLAIEIRRRERAGAEKSKKVLSMTTRRNIA